MIQTRFNTARESERVFKISKISIVKDSKQIYTVLGSPNGRKNYEVTICCSPSCTCPDYKKNGKNVLCKRIMFTFLYALKVGEEAFLSEIYISERELRKVFKDAPKKPPENYMQIKRLPVGRNYNEIFKKYINFDSQQLFEFQRKGGSMAATCKEQCRKEIVAGELCIKVYNALVVPFGKESATVNTVYVCPKKECVLKTPRWVRLVVPPVFQSSLNVTDTEKAEAAKEIIYHSENNSLQDIL